MSIIVAIMAQGTTRAGLPQLVTIEAIAEASAVCGNLGFARCRYCRNRCVLAVYTRQITRKQREPD